MMKIYIYTINETYLDSRGERALSALPLWRVEKYRRMIPKKGKLLSLAAGLLLRHALLDTTGTELKELEIGFNRHEKPYLKGGELQDSVFFNLSHAGDYVALAVTDTPVGIDVETKQDPGHGVAEHVFSPEEQEAMRASEDPARYFTRLWTRKEAYVKCTGTGISVSLNELSVLPDEIISGEKAYQIRTLRETDEYALSVCVESVEFPQFSLDIVEEFDI